MAYSTPRASGAWFSLYNQMMAENDTTDFIKSNTKKVRIYIDGFNFYHSLKNLYPDRPKYKRINYKKLVEQFLLDGEIVKGTYLFTAYYSENISSGRYQRHKTFNKALMANGIQIILGNFISKDKTLHKSSIIGVKPPEKISNMDDIDSVEYHIKEEKKTDVNLAIKIVEDAYENRFDIAYVISCDTDIVPAIKLVKFKFPNKRLINLRIANSVGRDIQNICHDCVEVSSKHIENSLMEDNLEDTNGVMLSIPVEWKEAKQKLL